MSKGYVTCPLCGEQHKVVEYGGVTFFPCPEMDPRSVWVVPGGVKA